MYCYILHKKSIIYDLNFKTSLIKIYNLDKYTHFSSIIRPVDKLDKNKSIKKNITEIITRRIYRNNHFDGFENLIATIYLFIQI